MTTKAVPPKRGFDEHMIERFYLISDLPTMSLDATNTSSLQNTTSDVSLKDSPSESSSSSPNPMSGSRDHDLCIFGSNSRLNRSATVRRVSAPKKIENTSADDFMVVHQTNIEKYRRSLDSTYRHSLESISEYKTKNNFSLYPNRNACSMDSASSDCTDYGRRHSSDTFKDCGDKNFVSPSTSYLSWIESVSSEFFGTASSNTDIVDVDNKVGEWNNFWLNYNNPHNRYVSTHYKGSVDDRTADDVSDCKSTCSTHKDYDKISTEHIVLTYDEVMDIMHYSQKITETLQKAIRRNDEIEHSRNDSYYSQQTSSYCEEIPRDRGFSYTEPEVQKQKQLLKPPSTQPGSCINALLTTGVADILKRVMNKRKDVLSTEDGAPTSGRASFSSK
ncbi:uncharacterized protein [Onthophagus taurus]|uniref:uncharacterized protein n=1 Tax=Onthophagus taurus TaxID=166361 RepID=UPI000C2055AD|nr:uncharacterized protein LOC111420489 [Onthophagus taurus]